MNDSPHRRFFHWPSLVILVILGGLGWGAASVFLKQAREAARRTECS